MSRKKRRTEFRRNQQRIHDLEHELEIVRADWRQQVNRNTELQDRLFRAGMDPERDYLRKLPTRCLTASVDVTDEDMKGLPYGNYVVFHDEVPEETMELLKEKLTTSLVKGMIMSNMVRFIYREPDLPFNGYTLAARIDVVPWERITNIRTEGRIGGRVFDERETSRKNAETH